MTHDEVVMDIKTVAVHEIGNLIELDHSKLCFSIVYSSISPGKIKCRLICDDIKGSIVLYGPRTSEQHHTPYTGSNEKLKEHGCLNIFHKNDFVMILILLNLVS